MPMIQIPHSFRKFLLEYEYWKRQWVALALIHYNEETNSDADWFKGTGLNPDLAAKDLFLNIQSGTKLSALEKVSMPTASTSKGFRNLEKAKAEKEKNSTPLEDLF